MILSYRSTCVTCACCSQKKLQKNSSDFDALKTNISFHTSTPAFGKYSFVINIYKFSALNKTYVRILLELEMFFLL